MTSSDTSFTYFENLNISKAEQDSEKPKTPFRFIWKCCFVALEIGSTIFLLQWHLKLIIFTVCEPEYINMPPPSIIDLSLSPFFVKTC